MKEIPRWSTSYVNGVMMNDKTTIKEKARLIWNNDQDMLSREYDRNKPRGMSIKEIENILLDMTIEGLR